MILPFVATTLTGECGPWQIGILRKSYVLCEVTTVTLWAEYSRLALWIQKHSCNREALERLRGLFIPHSQQTSL